jgi:hypothetical protein
MEQLSGQLPGGLRVVSGGCSGVVVVDQQASISDTLRYKVSGDNGLWYNVGVWMQIEQRVAPILELWLFEKSLNLKICV